MGNSKYIQIGSRDFDKAFFSQMYDHGCSLSTLND